MSKQRDYIRLSPLYHIFLLPFHTVYVNMYSSFNLNKRRITMTTSTKTIKPIKEKSGNVGNFFKSIGQSIVQMYQLIVTIAQYMGAYALFYQDSNVLRTIACVLAFNATFTAFQKYTRK